jgi:hypothetical protein
MRARTQATSLISDADVPLELRAGPCVEQWSADGSKTRAFYAWLHARKRFLDARGLDWTRDWRDLPGCLRGGQPWSFAEMADLPGRGAWLEQRGLPASWTPQAACPEDFGSA